MTANVKTYYELRQTAACGLATKRVVDPSGYKPSTSAIAKRENLVRSGDSTNVGGETRAVTNRDL